MKSEGVPQAEAREKPPVPRIYSLIEQGASIEQISAQLYADFYAPEIDNEKVYLAIDYLQSLGLEGEEAIETLASSSDSLGSLMLEIQDTGASGQKLEELLGIERMPHLVDEAEFDSFEGVAKVSYEYARKKGYTKLTPRECYEKDHEVYMRSKDNPSHLSGEIDDELLSSSSTFGIAEPEYLELIGPREILRLRSIEHPNMLLLGSYGVYSAREFRAYARKLNPGTNAFVIDISPRSIAKLAGDPENNGTLVEGDARVLPYADESMEHLYTNKLLRFIGMGEHKLNIQEDIANLFSEALRVLKPGGSLVMCEAQSKVHDDDEPLFYARAIVHEAKEAGFIVDKSHKETLSITLRPEVGSPTIDSNGFPQYKDALIERHEGYLPFGVRFIKPH